MKITPIKTPIVHAGDDMLQLIKQAVPSLPEKSILVITSKVVALWENNVRPTDIDKHDLVRQEAEYYTEPSQSAYDIMLTVKHGILAVNAGIDKSNAGGQYVLLPDKPYVSAEKIWKFLKQEYGLNQVGVLITDSKTFPLKWGTMGTSLAHCGFKALLDKRGDTDLFGYEMQMTQVNVAEGLAAAAVVEMGEVDEAMPLCVIEDARQVEFVDHPPTVEEQAMLKIELEADAYAPILTKAEWQQR
ncbi:MAG TPA: coenzyme F420-0:L-glutamate ligase [Patescibacteria group bacterium]